MNEQQFEKLVTNLQDVMRCPNCSSGYFLDDIHYLGQMESMTFLHLRCHKCSTPVFASVAVAATDGSIIGTEINNQIIKARKFPSSQEGTFLRKVTHNDVLDVHSALETSKDDLDKFFKI